MEPSTSEEAGQLKEFEVKLEELSDEEGEEVKEHASAEPSPPPTRTSSRRRKPVKRFEFGEFAEVKTEEYNDVKQEFGFDEEENMEEQEQDDEVDMDELEYEREEYSPFSPSIDPRRSTSPSGRIRRLRVFFSPEERCEIFRFTLSECKSKTPGKEGRVGKQRVQIMSSKFWEKFKALYGYERRTDVYRLHYNLYSKKLHAVPGLTLEERVDLYYAMEMPVTDRKERAVLIEKFGVTIDEKNIVRGSTVLQHWDYTNEGSDEEEEEEEYRDKLPYVEYHDGLQWQFMVDRINEGQDPLNYGSKLWRIFREHHKTQALVRSKAVLGYTSRCRRVLLPNLHIMPFDMEAKAALYESLEYPVPKEFREELITATGVELSPSGYIEEYASRPPEIILQSNSYQSSIGLTNRTTYSSLREPEGWHLIPEDDRTPWSDSEDRQILEWMRAQAMDTDTGRLKKIQVPRKMTDAMEYWKKYREEHKTERGLRTLATRFHRLHEDLIYSTVIDSKMKLELYYILSKPVDVEAGEVFKAFSILVIDEDARIRFALAVDYLLGRTDGELIDEDKYSFFYDIRVLRKIVGRSRIFDNSDSDEQAEIGRQIMKTIEQREWHEQGKISNSMKFPYCGPSKQPPRILKRSNQQSSYPPYLPPSKKKQTNKFETIGGIDWDDGDEHQQGPSTRHPTASNPPIKLSDAMKSVEMSMSVVKMHIARFHAELRTASKTMTDERRLQCLTEIEQLTRMFRFSGKQALTLPVTPKPKKSPKKPKEKKITE